MNEARAICALYEDGAHPNLVFVRGHGWRLSQGFYYIDMDICDFNLHNYIRDTTLSHAAESRNLYDFTSLSHARETGKRKIWDTWDIMEQISSGIEYIH